MQTATEEEPTTHTEEFRSPTGQLQRRFTLKKLGQNSFSRINELFGLNEQLAEIFTESFDFVQGLVTFTTQLFSINGHLTRLHSRSFYHIQHPDFECHTEICYDYDENGHVRWASSYLYDNTNKMVEGTNWFYFKDTNQLSSIIYSDFIHGYFKNCGYYPNGNLKGEFIRDQNGITKRKWKEDGSLASESIQ